MARLRSNGAPRRGGFAYRGLMVALVVLSALPLIAWNIWPRFSFSAQEAAPMMHTVARGQFLHEITNRGNVESANNVEIRCEVEAKGTPGTTILQIVPEGTAAQPGDVLVRLDSSAFEKELTNQQILCANSQADVIQAENVYETAKIAKREYLEGQYELDKLTILNAKTEAEEYLRRAVEYLKYSERLAAKGYVTALQLEADRFALEKAKNELDSAETELKVLEEFTKEKQSIQLEADIKTAEANLKAKQASHDLDIQERTRIEDQIKKCVIRSPEAGQVVYANVSNRRGGREIIIDEGELVRERQVIIRLPDSKRMQVVADINEAKITMVKPGMPVTIRLDAFPELELKGTVEKVNEFPEPTSWHSVGVKEYRTIIRIDGSPPGLRPGLSAEVRIHAEHIPDALQVPVQAIFEHGAKYYYVTFNRGKHQAHEVRIGSTNDKFIVIPGGLEQGQQVVLNAAAYRDKVDLPELVAENHAPPPGPATPGRKQPPGATASPPPQPPARAGERFAALDADGNGRIEGSEMPEQMKAFLQRLDANGDGAVDRAEMNAAVSRKQEQGSQPRSGPGGPGKAASGGSR